MKDSIRVLEIYRQYLETTGELVEILEGHCKKEVENCMSSALKNKYKAFRKHAHHLIESLNEDLHILVRIDNELKDIENEEKEI